MSFLKITDPKKSDFIVNEFLKTRKTSNKTFYQNVQVTRAHNTNFQSFSNQSQIWQQDLKEGLASELKPIREGMKHLPKAVTFPQYPSITAYDDDGEEEGKAVIVLPNNTCESLLPRPELIRLLDCGIRMVSFTLGARKQNKGKQYNCW